MKGDKPENERTPATGITDDAIREFLKTRTKFVRLEDGKLYSAPKLLELLQAGTLLTDVHTMLVKRAAANGADINETAEASGQETEKRKGKTRHGPAFARPQDEDDIRPDWLRDDEPRRLQKPATTGQFAKTPKLHPRLPIIAADPAGESAFGRKDSEALEHAGTAIPNVHEDTAQETRAGTHTATAMASTQDDPATTEGHPDYRHFGKERSKTLNRKPRQLYPKSVVNEFIHVFGVDAPEHEALAEIIWDAAFNAKWQKLNDAIDECLQLPGVRAVLDANGMGAFAKQAGESHDLVALTTCIKSARIFLDGLKRSPNPAPQPKPVEQKPAPPPKTPAARKKEGKKTPAWDPGQVRWSLYPNSHVSAFIRTLGIGTPEHEGLRQKIWGAVLRGDKLALGEAMNECLALPGIKDMLDTAGYSHYAKQAIESCDLIRLYRCINSARKCISRWERRPGPIARPELRRDAQSPKQTL